MNKITAATFTAAVLFLSGCVATENSHILVEHSPLTFGVTGVKSGNSIVANGIAGRSGLTMVPLESEDAASRVDVIVKITTSESLIETFSARTRKQLTSGHVSFWTYSAMYDDAAKHLTTEFSSQTNLFKQIMAEKNGGQIEAPAAAAPSVAAAPALPPSPAPNYSAAERDDDLAVIVGIESYSDIAAKAPYAERDADAFKAHVRALGVPERNIVLIKGAKAGRASLVKNVEQWLPRMAKADSRVYFYFSGHGAPDVKTGQAYLVPWDGDPNFLESTAYPVAQLYKKLGELPAKQVLVAMDSCFSGAGGRSVLASGARPLLTKIDASAAPAKLTVLAASASNEISGSLDDKGHGAFTYFLLRGLDAGKRTPKELVDYLTPRVQDEARRLNRDQTPQLQGDGGWALR